MRTTFYKDKKLRSALEDNETYYKVLKFLMADARLADGNLKFITDSILKNKASLVSLYKVKNVCVLSGRSRSVYRHFGISRLAIKDFGWSGALKGLKGSSW